eukprot:75012-Chlamydomonas_euryale.AAC.4
MRRSDLKKASSSCGWSPPVPFVSSDANSACASAWRVRSADPTRASADVNSASCARTCFSASRHSRAASRNCCCVMELHEEAGRGG